MRGAPLNLGETPGWRLRGHQPGDLGWVVSRHGALYVAEQGWDETFEGFVAAIAAEFLLNHDPARERCWVAEDDVTAQRLGSVTVMRGEDDGTAKLRMLIVDPAARGRGVGAALVAECTRFARVSGYARLRLWTYASLTAARRLYAREGYTLIASEPRRAYGHDLVGEEWELPL